MIYLYACVSGDVEPKQPLKNTKNFALTVPQEFASKTGIKVKTEVRDIFIPNPNKRDEILRGKLVYKADYEGNAVALEISYNVYNELNLSSEILVSASSEKSTCAERRQIALNKCTNGCNEMFPNPSGDSQRDCKISCNYTAILATIYDSTVGFFADCYYPE